MKNSKNFILGWCGGSVLVFFLTSWNLLWGSLIMGAIIGAMNYELQNCSPNTRETTE